MTPKARKLLIFGLASFVILAATAFGLYIPYLKAYNLVHPVRTRPDKFPRFAYQEVEFPSTDGLTLAGWYLPPQNGALVIFVHGLGGNCSELVEEADFLAKAGYGALLLDLRNHGQSAGERTTLGLYESDDVVAAARFARSQPGGDSVKLALFGHSMGGATVLLAAVKIPEARAIIAESAYSSVTDNINEGVEGLTGLPPFPFAPLVLFFGQREAGVSIETVRPVDVIGQISPRPVLLVHGEQDKLVPVENSRRLYAAAHMPKELYILPGAGHFPFLNAEPVEYPRRILDFLNRYLLP
jgi:fermentation-respiration switch protein FrsA (DUF1100 family)